MRLQLPKAIRKRILWGAIGLAALIALVVGLAVSRKAAPKALPAASSVAALRVPAVLPKRAEVVALADQLAVQGSRKGGSEGAKLTQQAARLRLRLWRLEHREADALEAVELFRSLGQRSWPYACEAELERALLEAELRLDPSELYRRAYVLSFDESSKSCSERVDQVLRALAAYEPAPKVLAELEQEARRGAKASLAPAASVEPVKKSKPRESIVLPKVPDKQQGRPKITAIERYGSKDAARIVVFMTHPALFEVGAIPRVDAERGPRLYVDIGRARYEGPLAYEVGGLVQRVRIGHHKTGTRVVLDLSEAVYRKVFYLPEPFRLIVDVSTEPPQAVERPHDGPRLVRRVVLDPGHGGHDPGATGPTGLREKDVTLDIAHRAAPLIARELGVSTLLTRDTDEFVPLDERAARANAFQADLFVSIHCNASENGKGSGVMTFVLDESKDALGAQIAARENAATPAAAAELATAMSQVLDAGSVAASVHFAELLQRAAMSSLTARYGKVLDHGVRRAGFYVLAGARMPAVLFETSFISNPNEEMYLNTGDYRQKLADAIVNAVRAYREGR